MTTISEHRRATWPASAATVVEAARPRQWVKNLVVLAVPVAAGRLGDPGVPGRLAITFAVFCCVASGTYLLNDARDVEADRLHPRKRLRPVASGRLGALDAERAGGALVVIGIAAAALLNWVLGLVVLGYAVLTAAYSARLKREPVVDVVALASGYVLRAVAGAVAVGMAPAGPVLVAVGSGTLLVGVGKRLGEQRLLGAEAALHRDVLGRYPPGFLAQLATVAMVGALAAYWQWAVAASVAGAGRGWLVASVLPFTVAILRYGYVAARGEAGDPEAALRGDPVLCAAAAVAVAAALVGVYVR